MGTVRDAVSTPALPGTHDSGGAAVTDEFHPGFRNSAASYTVSLLQPKVIKDMALERHGLQVVLRKKDNFLPDGKGPYLLTGRDDFESAAHLAEHRTVRPDGSPVTFHMPTAALAAERTPAGEPHDDTQNAQEAR